jgi:hypothetical protein
MENPNLEGVVPTQKGDNHSQSSFLLDWQFFSVTRASRE